MSDCVGSGVMLLELKDGKEKESDSDKKVREVLLQIGEAVRQGSETTRNCLGNASRNLMT